MAGDRRHNRQSNRWQVHDYAAGGTYFVTVCTEGRVCLFGEVRDGRMYSNASGLIVEQEWMGTGVIRPDVDIDVFAVMPNHLHGLVTITPPATSIAVWDAETSRRAHSGVPLRRPRSLSSIVGQFKATSTRTINELRGTPGAKVWQRGFHDRMVRNDEEFDRIASYIVTNPDRWMDDPDHP